MSLAYTDINPCLVHASLYFELIERDINPVALGEIVPLMAMQLYWNHVDTMAIDMAKFLLSGLPRFSDPEKQDRMFELGNALRAIIGGSAKIAIPCGCWNGLIGGMTIEGGDSVPCPNCCGGWRVVNP